MTEEPANRYVEVYRWIARAGFKSVGRHGPMTSTEARAKCVELRGLLGKKHRVRIVNDRKAYFAVYHRQRAARDAEYRARRNTRASRWNKQQRAKARGDFITWLATEGKHHD